MRAGFEDFSFNTAVARLMELVNAMYKYDKNERKNGVLAKSVAKDVVRLIAPAAPHFSEQLWQDIGEEYSIHNQLYPVCDETKLVRSSVEIAVQVNSKIITRMNILANAANDEILKVVKANERVKPLLEGKNILKEIIVPGRIVNIIVK